MIRYTKEARRHVRDSIAHYRRKQRPEAVRNLDAALARAEAAIAAGPVRPRPYPATYRDLAHPNTAWIHEGIYWIAYRKEIPPIITAVFWDQAEIDRRCN